MSDNIGQADFANIVKVLETLNANEYVKSFACDHEKKAYLLERFEKPLKVSYTFIPEQTNIICSTSQKTWIATFNCSILQSGKEILS